MNSRLTVTETVELLNQLKATVRDCAAAEEKLNRELRGKTELVEKRFKEESAAREKQLAGRLREAVPHYERVLADRERVQGRDHRDTLTARSNRSIFRCSCITSR